MSMTQTLTMPDPVIPVSEKAKILGYALKICCHMHAQGLTDKNAGFQLPAEDLPLSAI